MTNEIVCQICKATVHTDYIVTCDTCILSVCPDHIVKCVACGQTGCTDCMEQHGDQWYCGIECLSDYTGTLEIHLNNIGRRIEETIEIADFIPEEAEDLNAAMQALGLYDSKLAIIKQYMVEIKLFVSKSGAYNFKKRGNHGQESKVKKTHPWTYPEEKDRTGSAVEDNEDNSGGPELTCDGDQ